MPKLVSELTQGQEYSRSADGGQLADTATRVWRVVMDAPNEFLYLDQVTGVTIGDPLSPDNPIPCVSLDLKADGDSRMVRIITATYRTQAGGSGQDDPGTQSPDVRPANFSTTTSLYETAAYQWRDWPGGQWKAPVNACDDVIDGVTKLEPITTIRVTQFDFAPGTRYASYCGYINSQAMSLGGYMFCEPHTVMFRGVEAQPHVESFGSLILRGFMNVFEFAYRLNVVDGMGPCGWDATPLNTGFRVKAFNPNAPGGNQDVFGQPLKHAANQVVFPLVLPAGVQAGDKVRAMVRIHDPENGGITLLPSAQPVALNEDGTPRSLDPIIWRRQVQPDIDLTDLLKLRLQ